MKKYLLLLASAALLLVGCAKEQLSNGVDGEMTKVSFTATVDGGVVTRASADGDGNGANVNRCIMEIYFGETLYTRLVEPVTPASEETKAFATFANVPVVAGKQYQVLFWADYGEELEELEELVDKYYTTKTEGEGNKGLKAVAIKHDAFIGALAAGKNDELDAFFFAKNYIVPQGGGNYEDIELKRPFAQLNVITTDVTDVGVGKPVFNEGLLPEKVYVSYKAANEFDVSTGVVSGEDTYTYVANVYGAWGTVATNQELTLSMDYILASTKQGVVNVTFKTLKGENVETDAVMTHELNYLPFRRNYRTNVKGDLLTTTGSWKAEIDPIWSEPDIVKVVEVADIKSANEIINQYAGTTDNLEVKFTGEPNDSGVPTGEEAGIRAIVTTPIKENASLSIEVLTQTKQLYIGDYKDEYIVTGEDFIDNSAKHAVVNVNVPQSSAITALVINAPSKSVYINGKEVANVGTITDLDAITSQNTLIIEKGQTVTNLTIRQGGLEIHGTVETLVIEESDHEKKPVLVRTSENLSQGVFDEIYKEESGVVEHDYIDRPDYSERKNDDKWDIVPSVCKISETGKAYGSVEDAFKAVENGQTIVMLRNDVLTKGQTITLENAETFTLDLNGKTISIAETGFDFTANNTKEANKIRNGIPARFAIVVNGQGTMNICDNSTEKLGRLETKNYSYTTTKTILVDGNAIVNVNSGTVAADYAAFYVVGDTETGAVQVVDRNPKLNVSGGKILGQEYGIAAKGSTAIIKITGGEIVSKNQPAVSTNGTTDWYNGGGFAIEITGGTIKSENAAALYLPAEGPTVITGGTFEGAEGIAVKGGTLSISGDVVVKAVGLAKEQAHAASSDNSHTGSCIYVEDTYPDHKPIVNISGGKFSSANNKAVEYFTNKTDDASNKGKVTLTGGIYSDAPAASFAAEGYAVLDNSDATTKAEYPYTVKVKPVVKIGNVEYADIADAFAEVPTDETATTVTLLENIGSKDGDNIVWEEYAREFAYTINDGQNITFDMNGKKIYAKTTVNGYTGFLLVKNGGSLTIKDSAGGGELNYLDGNDNNGGLAISSEGKLTIESGTIENHTVCVSSAIQGAIDVHANEWGTSYTHHVTFKMDGGVLKSQNNNTLRIYDSSQTGKGTVVFDFEINGGEIYGADAVFIMTQWTKTYCTGDTYMNNINASVKGGKFVTKNGIRVVGNVGEDNNKDYYAIKINVSGGDFTILSSKESKHRVNNVAFQETANWTSNEESTAHLRSYTEVIWTASEPKYETPAQQ